MLRSPHNAGRVLVIAPHPDDEVLGCGGTIARLVRMNCNVEIAIVTEGKSPRYDRASVEKVRAEAAAAHALLGVRSTHYLELPAAELDGVPHADLNAAMGALIEATTPDTIFVPFVGDIHLDHQLVFRSTMVAARPRKPTYPHTILAYETLSETNWSAPYLEPVFAPTVYVDISSTLDAKLAAFAAYESQCCIFPNERSPEAIRALAALRGATVHRHAAEAFVLVREVI
ncbi:MAG: PIG-L deacetylase family protein [Sphingomonas sp.]